MKKRWKSIIALGLSTIMCLSLAGCGGGSDTAASSGSSNGGTESAAADSGAADAGAESGGAESDSGDKVITFWNVGTEGADKETYEMAIRQFNENTKSGYTIENIPTQNDKYKEKLVIAMSSGECPDMYTSWSGGPMNEYIDSGYAQPLDDLYAKYSLND